MNIVVQYILETRTERHILGCFSYCNFKILPAFRRSSYYSLFQNCSTRITVCTSQTASAASATTEISRDRYLSNITCRLLSSRIHNIAGHPYYGYLNLSKNYSNHCFQSATSTSMENKYSQNNYFWSRGSLNPLLSLDPRVFRF